MEPSKPNAFLVFVQRFATPITAAIFTVTIVSGIALFFELQPDFFREMHEWLSIVLLLPFAFHVWKNWRAIVKYFRRGALYFPAIAAYVESRREHPLPPAVRAIAEASLHDVAPVLKTTPDALAAKLNARGYAVRGNDDTLSSVARAAHVPVAKLVREMTTSDPHAPDDDD